MADKRRHEGLRSRFESRRMPRPDAKPHLVPRQPRSVLAWSMQKQRQVHGWTGKRVAEGFGCSPSHISRVEQGHSRPSRPLVEFYEAAFGADGLLLSLFAVVEHHGEQERRRAGGRRPQLVHAAPGDASSFIGDTVANGSLMKPGEVFEKTWTIRNSGTVSWVGRRLERQGPLTGPGLITSARYVPVPDAPPGHEAKIIAVLKAPTYESSAIAYFKLTHSDGALCFPDQHQLGLEAVIRVGSDRR